MKHIAGYKENLHFWIDENGKRGGMGNYSIFQQLTGVADYAAMADAGYSTAQIIAEIIKTLPMAQIVMFLVILTMIALFVTTFDANCLMLAWTRTS